MTTTGEAHILRRAQPWLGTLVSVQVEARDRDDSVALQAVDLAFAVVADVHAAMSAHRPDSDLARLARAVADVPLTLQPQTIAVLQLAQRWRSQSRGAFDPEAAGRRLAARGRRPGIAVDASSGRFAALRFLDERTVVADGPLQIDLGGIAKGHAVDCAVRALRAMGMESGLINAGGDLRAFGPRTWTIDVQHAAVRTRSQKLLRLRDGAVATSTGARHNAEFVGTRPRAAGWERCTVQAPDCVTADALTKWGLQDREPSLALRRALRSIGARMWRQ